MGMRQNALPWLQYDDRAIGRDILPGHALVLVGPLRVGHSALRGAEVALNICLIEGVVAELILDLVGHVEPFAEGNIDAGATDVLGNQWMDDDVLRLEGGLNLKVTIDAHFYLISAVYTLA